MSPLPIKLDLLPVINLKQTSMEPQGNDLQPNNQSIQTEECGKINENTSDKSKFVGEASPTGVNSKNVERLVFSRKGNVCSSISSSEQPKPPAVGKMEIEESSSSQDNGQIIKAQLQYHYQDNQGESEQSSEEYTSSPNAVEQVKEGAVKATKLVKSRGIKKSGKSKFKKVRKGYKCGICKGSGKKGEMKKCKRCREYLHINCLQEEEESLPDKYVCQRCAFQQGRAEVINIDGEEREEREREEGVPEESGREEESSNYMTRKDRIFLQKLSCNRRRANRSNKKGALFQQFKKRYPYYVQGDKIKYPIDDRLLVIYGELLQVEDKTRYPPMDHPSIPSEHLGNFLEIQNWLISFRELIRAHFPQCSLPDKLDKEYLYAAMCHQGFDQVYVGLFCVMLRIFLSDIFEGNRKQNMRMLGEHSFFNLLAHLKESGDLTDEFIVSSGHEIISQLATVPSFKVILSEITVPQQLDVTAKSSFVIELLRGLTQTNGFKMIATKKTEAIQELIDRKGKLIAKIKLAETGKLQNREKIKEFEEIMQEEESSNSQEEQQQSKKKRKLKQRQKARKKLKQINTQNTLTQSELVETRQKLNECLRSLQFATTDIIFLGKDRNGSQFFFSRYQPQRVYVYYRQFLTDCNKVYKLYEGKERIAEILKNLSCKGVSQKRLHHNLNSLMKLNMLKQTSQTQTIPLSNNINVFTYEVNRSRVLKYFKEIQHVLHRFYKERGMQWCNSEQRAATFASLQEEQDVRKVAEIISNVHQLFLNVQIKSENPKKAIKKAYGIIFQNELKLTNINFNKRKMLMRIWGSNLDKIKKNWTDYLLKDPNYVSIWICLDILKNNVNKFMKRKIEAQQNQKRKYEKMELLNGKKDLKGDQQQESGQGQAEGALEMSRLRRSRSYRENNQHSEREEAQNKQSNDPSDQTPLPGKKRKRRQLSYLDDVQVNSKRTLRNRKNQQDNENKSDVQAQEREKASEQVTLKRRKKQKNKQISEQNEIQEQPSKKKRKHKHKKHKQDFESNKHQSPPKQSSRSKHRHKRAMKLESEQQQDKQVIPARTMRTRRLTFQSQSEAQTPDEQSQNSPEQKIQELTGKQNEQANEDGKVQKGRKYKMKYRQNRKSCRLCHTETDSSALTCFQCKKTFHLNCVNLNRKPKTQWICVECTNQGNSRLTRSKK